MKGTEKDIGPWFIGGKGIDERFAGLGINADGSGNAKSESRESVEEQEQRRSKKKSTVPRCDQSEQPSDKEIGLYVLGLQEIVDVGSATEAFKPYTDPTAANRYKAGVEFDLPRGYTLVAERQLIGMLLLIYASPKVAPDIKSVSTTSVGTGLMGYMGNKGGVTARIVLGETTRVVFINSHLGAGAEKGSAERRNWDAAQIVTRTKFDPISDTLGTPHSSGEQIGDEDFAFWFGDLNYRLDAPGEDVRRLLMLHTQNAYDLNRQPGKRLHAELEKDVRRSNLPASASTDDLARSLDSDVVPDDPESKLDPEDDPASLQTTLLSLLSHDELHAQMASRKAFHDGWQEGQIRFLPTYKYDVGSVGVFDSSDKRRGPSWCDRILYRTRTELQDYKRKIREEEEARRKDEEMKAKGIADAANDDDLLFDYNPSDDEYDEHAEPETQPVVTRAGNDAEILQEYYNAHQRVLSSDHKPLDAIFSLTYDAVDVALKAKIHAEVAKELDRAENEGRPTVTVIADKVHGDDHGEEGGDESPIDPRRPSNEGIDFGRVRFGKAKVRNVTIANTGQVDATVCFVDRPVAGGRVELEGPAPVWMSVRWDRAPDASPKPKGREPAMYTLEPGEACNVTLVVTVEAMELVNRLNGGEASLDDVLILRVRDGRDHFLPVGAKWVASGVDRAMNKLTSLKEEAVRKLQRQEPDASGSGSSH